MQYSDRLSFLGTESAFEVLARAKKLEAAGKKIIHLEIGEPDFDTPANISEAGIKAIRESHTHYCPSGGIPAARKVVADYFNRTRKTDVNSDMVVIMPGAKPVIFNSIFATINPGDEVIVPDPGYPTYESVVGYAGGRPIPMPLREENDFRFDTNELEKLVTSRTRMIIINSPQNPTGGILTREDLETIFHLAEKHDLWILTDEIYSRIIYDREFDSITTIPGAMERTIVVDGMSKTYSMTGWRLGYGVMPVRLADHLVKLAVNNFSCTATFSQYALIEALNGPQDEVNEMVAEFQKRRDLFVDGLNGIENVSCLKPKGAFYLFANISRTGLTSAECAELLLNDAGIACLSGATFGKYGEGYIRFSYANSVENIECALVQMKNTLAGIVQT